MFQISIFIVALTGVCVVNGASEDDGRYRPTNEGRYYPDNSGAYVPDNSGAYDPYLYGSAASQSRYAPGMSLIYLHYNYLLVYLLNWMKRYLIRKGIVDL